MLVAFIFASLFLRIFCESNYDVIVVGSGVGGLTAAGSLAAHGKRVVVVEQASKIGGSIQTFTREDTAGNVYQFPVGMHYVNVLPVMPFELCTEPSSRLSWHHMDTKFGLFRFGPNPNASVLFGASSLTAWMNDLIAMFPHERNHIEQFFVEVSSMQSTARKEMFADAVSRIFGPNYPQKEPLLWTLLSSDLPDLDELASQVPWTVFGNLLHAWYQFGGMQYPDLGSQSVVDLLVDQIKTGGGTMVTDAKVTKILVEEDKEVGEYRVVGVEGIDGKGDVFRMESEWIVSSMGTKVTFASPMIPEEVLEKTGYGKKAKNGVLAGTMCIAFLGFNETDDVLGFPDKNVFYVESTRGSVRAGGLPSSFDGSSSTFISKRAPGILRGQSVSVITMMFDCDYDWFLEWENTTVGQRPKEYYEWKSTALEGSAIRHIKAMYPKIEKHVAVLDSATPLTLRDFLNAPKGSWCGVVSKDDWVDLQMIPGISGLVMVGKEFDLCGVTTSAKSGLVGASRILHEER